MAEQENKEKTLGQKLKDELFYKAKNTYEVLSDEEIAKAYEYAEGYKKFLDKGKTEREFVKESAALLEKNGFIPYTFGMKVIPGGKYYYNNRGKSLSAFVLGTEPLTCGVYFSAAHIDSPRVDLKQHPLYEAEGLGFLKTHYYGGIKKYQWTTIPLALHGVVTKADGTTVDVIVGEEESDPIFYIDDLLPHLAGDQMRKSLADGISGEQLNLLSGSRPFEKNLSEAVKLNILKLLHDKYGITEADLMSAELCAVPAYKARDIGFDRSLIGAYGHDDKVCAYPSLTALIAVENPVHTTMAVLADKEEIGSCGNTGMDSMFFENAASELLDKTEGYDGLKLRRMLRNSYMLSSDVNSAFDPLNQGLYDKKNSSFLGRGVVFNRYTGGRGKSSASEANAEFIAKLRKAMDDNGVKYQAAEMSKVDVGGGGTIAKYSAYYGMEVIDCGVAVLSMHAPWEITAASDVKSAYSCYKAFLAL